MELSAIYQGASVLINSLIRREFVAQGHHLTGQLEDSLTAEINKNTMRGYAVGYAKIIEEGLEPDEVSSKMIPGLIRYFQLRGLDQANAVRAAQFTFAKWKREGLSTQASKRFSQTGSRHHFVEAAFLHFEIDEYMSNGFDFAIDEQYLKTKSETV